MSCLMAINNVKNIRRNWLGIQRSGWCNFLSIALLSGDHHLSIGQLLLDIYNYPLFFNAIFLYTFKNALKYASEYDYKCLYRSKYCENITVNFGLISWHTNVWFNSSFEKRDGFCIYFNGEHHEKHDVFWWKDLLKRFVSMLISSFWFFLLFFCFALRSSLRFFCWKRSIRLETVRFDLKLFDSTFVCIERSSFFLRAIDKHSTTAYHLSISTDVIAWCTVRKIRLCFKQS